MKVMTRIRKFENPTNTNHLNNTNRNNDSGSINNVTNVMGCGDVSELDNGIRAESAQHKN